MSKELAYAELVRFLRDELDAKQIKNSKNPSGLEEWSANDRRFLIRLQADGRYELFCCLEPFARTLMKESLLLLTYPEGKQEALWQCLESPAPKKNLISHGCNAPANPTRRPRLADTDAFRFLDALPAEAMVGASKPPAHTTRYSNS